MSKKRAGLWSLVLRARRVPHRVRGGAAGYTVQVPQRFLAQAVDEILLYQRENVSPDPAIPLPDSEDRVRPTVTALLLLCAFFVLTQQPWPAIDSYPQYWRRVGVGDAGLFLDGQLWRAVTALTLHADPAHVSGNAVIGGVFLILLARRVGSGAAWLLALLAGALGNACNAWVQGPGHVSIGFSTAVFGAAGVLAALKALGGEGGLGRSRPSAESGRPVVLARGRAWIAPVAAALALAAMLGTAGPNTDIGAHFFGLFAGGVLGAAFGLAAWRFGRPEDWLAGRFNALSGILAFSLPFAAWIWGWLAIFQL